MSPSSGASWPRSVDGLKLCGERGQKERGEEKSQQGKGKGRERRHGVQARGRKADRPLVYRL
jgi:hypothetical protein